MPMGVCRKCFRMREKYLRGKFEIDGRGTNEGAENQNRTAKSVNILICFKILRSF